MILLMREPLTRTFIALRLPGEAHLFRLFTRNGWRPHGEQARRLALELAEKQIHEIADSVASDR